ncbi:unnamed protein product, partial [Ectocarpus sp. 12 AP-2014]
MGRTLGASLSYTLEVHRPAVRIAATPTTAARPKATSRGIVAAISRAASRVFARATSKASGATASSTAANATSAAAAPAFVGSPSTQGVASGGRGGHGNGLNPSPVNAPKAPVIVAVYEVIDRPEYKRNNRLLVIPDEHCVATRFLLIDPSRASLRLANG